MDIITGVNGLIGYNLCLELLNKYNRKIIGIDINNCNIKHKNFLVLDFYPYELQ